jgi:hypothetical protein
MKRNVLEKGCPIWRPFQIMAKEGDHVWLRQKMKVSL